jgi:hypothetical protein
MDVAARQACHAHDLAAATDAVQCLQIGIQMTSLFVGGVIWWLVLQRRR